MDRLNENITLDNLYLFRFRICAKLPFQRELPNKNNFMDNFLQKKKKAWFFIIEYFIKQL